MCSFDDITNSVLLFGTFTDNYRHVLQLYSLTNRKVTHTMVMPLKNAGSAIGILPVGHGRCILFARNYTATCTIADIMRNNPKACEYKDKYTLPNWRSAVVLSDNGENVMVYGGIPNPGQPKHFVYNASVRDILCNTGSGWSKVMAEWPFGTIMITGYDTIKL